jgi:hypothetical protein
MENLILNRKQVTIEKNKEFLFKIPVLIKPMECEFLIEVLDVQVINTPVLFSLRSTHSESGTGSGAVQIPIHISEINTRTAIQNLALNFDVTGEYLLFGCTANKNIHFALSIIRTSARFL